MVGLKSSYVKMLFEYVKTANQTGRSKREKLRIFWLLTKNFRTRFGAASFNPRHVHVVGTKFGNVYVRDNFGDLKSLSSITNDEYKIRGFGGGAILDIGANIGLISASAARHNPKSKVYAFEPLKSNAELIRRNCPKAKVFNIGLGKKHEKVKLQVDEWGLMASTVDRKYSTHSVSFDVFPLDYIASKEKIGKVAWMKIDVEGMEMDVLTGAQNTIANTRRVSLETHSPQLHDQVLEFLKKNGFYIEMEKQEGQYGLIFANNHKAI